MQKFKEAPPHYRGEALHSPGSNALTPRRPCGRDRSGAWTWPRHCGPVALTRTGAGQARQREGPAGPPCIPCTIFGVVGAPTPTDSWRSLTRQPGVRLPRAALAELTAPRSISLDTERKR
ncbi:hypothetical protein NDU88_007984 [Pleurodeles waltl]|uniref:Uncharacterized protein n=1 Tax=Pleurodeles waltl TaxID=8319 RepID=A0AAV7U5A9_PLEWA|nr:hypothetical protein NDU88_007984 [Pleurodeles waltl]